MLTCALLWRPERRPALRHVPGGVRPRAAARAQHAGADARTHDQCSQTTSDTTPTLALAWGRRSGLGQLPELNTLVLTRNRIAKLRPAMLAGCTALAKLSLSHNALADLGGEKRTLNGRSICFVGLLAKGCAENGYITGGSRSS